MAPVH